MIWKKNAVSCLMWAVYLLMVGTAMVFTGRAVCASLGMAPYFEFVIPAVCFLFVGVLVFGLHRMAVKLDTGAGRTGKGLVWLERVLVLALFAAGILLRVSKLQPEGLAESEEPVYLKLAYVSADGQGILRFSHGIVYLYVCVLRLCFILLGNKAAAAVWLQIMMLLLSVLLLHTAIRKMAGRIPAVIMAAFFLLSPYMVERSMALSPEMLYLLLFSIVLSFLSQGVQFVPRWGFWLVAGVMSAVLCYLDVAGFLLLPLIWGVIVMKRWDAGRKILQGFLGSIAGFLLGAAGCVLADAAGSGKPVLEIPGAWMELYRWSGLQLSIKISGFDVMWLIALILCFMAWGVFGFWCGRGVERFTAWIFCLCIAVFLQFCGIFTEEMNGFCYIFLFSTILAGLGIRESMAVYPAEKKTAGGKEKAEKTDGGDSMVKEEDGETETDKDESAETAGMPEKESAKTVKISEEENTEAGEMSGEESMETEKKVKEKNSEAGEQPEKERKVEFLENPLPLPKKHEKRVMDYKLDSDKELGGYDIYVADDDDFDH